MLNKILESCIKKTLRPLDTLILIDTGHKTVRSDGQANRRQRKTPTPYTPQEYSRVWFSTAQSWDSEHSKLVEGIKMVRFSDGFDITEYDFLTLVISSR